MPFPNLKIIKDFSLESLLQYKMFKKSINASSVHLSIIERWTEDILIYII